MDVGVSHVPDDLAVTVELARVAEQAGLPYFGIADSPALHAGAFPAIQHVLYATDQLEVGTFVTNPVTRHPSVLSADFTALATMFTDRVGVGIGAGDSAVSSVGLRPASPQALAAAVSTIGIRLGGRAPVMVALSSLRTAALVPAEADGVILGGGLDPDWLARLIEVSERSAGHRLLRWGFAVGHLVAQTELVPVARAEVFGSVLSISRHGLGRDPAQRGVPPTIAARLPALYQQYDWTAHARSGGPNDKLAGQFPDLSRYLWQRFAVVGTPTQLAARLNLLAAQVQLDRLILTSVVPDPVAHIRMIGAELQPRLARLSTTS
jgi:5,10-methylenetetrahydromethanopterin reductase